MPTYEYRCSTCGKTYDKYQPIKERNLCPQCPLCGHATTRIFGQVNFARSTVQHEAVFSDVTGTVVTGAADLERQIHQINEEQGTHYVLADPTDPSLAGTDEGLDATRRAATETGEREGTTWL
jgi:putative FmdB family regulatory protein